MQPLIEIINTKKPTKVTSPSVLNGIFMISANESPHKLRKKTQMLSHWIGKNEEGQAHVRHAIQEGGDVPLRTTFWYDIPLLLVFCDARIIIWVAVARSRKRDRGCRLGVRGLFINYFSHLKISLWNLLRSIFRIYPDVLRYRRDLPQHHVKP